MATSAAYIDLDEAAAPATPAAGKVRVYAKTDGNAYQKDDAGTETGLASAGGSSLTVTENRLGADVTMTTANTPYDGPSQSLSDGTFLLFGKALVADASGAGAQNFTGKLWNGTTVEDSDEATVGGTFVDSLKFFGYVTIVGTETWKITVTADTNTNLIKAAAPHNGAGNNASVLIAVQIA